MTYNELTMVSGAGTGEMPKIDKYLQLNSRQMIRILELFYDKRIIRLSFDNH